MNDKLQNLSILVTGGAGFIGSHIVEYLAINGAARIRILDNLSTGSKANIEHLLAKFPSVEFMLDDVRSLDACLAACQGMDVVCHQAGLGSVPRSINNPLDSHNVNVNGFVNILLAARENSIKRIVYASSSSVYGTNNQPVKIEDDIGKALSPYAVTKHVVELYGQIFTDVYGLECIGLRYFNVFGPRQNPNGEYAAVIPKFISAVIKDQPPTINGDGSYYRDFTYVDNVVLANILALTTENANCYGQIFNVGTNSKVSIQQLYDLIKKFLNRECCKPVYGPKRKGDIPYSNASIDKISEYLGYKPIVYFEEGLKKTVEHSVN